MSEKIALDLEPFICEALSVNDKIYEDIDKKYNEDKLQFYNAAKKSCYYNHPMALESTFIATEYFRKALGLLESDSFNNKDLENIIKKGWKYLYTYINNKNTFTIEDYIVSFIKKKRGLDNLSDDFLNSQITIFVWYSNIFHPNKLIKTDYLNQCCNALKTRLSHYSDNTRISNKAPSKAKSELINKVILKLKQTGLTSSNFYEDKGYESFDEKVLLFKLKSELLYDYYNLSLPSIFPNINFKENDLKNILNCYLSDKSSIDDLDMNDLAIYIISSYQITALSKAYIESKSYYLSNSKDIYEVKIDELEKRIKDMSLRICDLENENKNLANDLIRKNKELKILNDEIKTMESNNEEVNALRKFIFSLENKEILNNEEVDINKINNINGMIIGGFDSLQTDLKNTLPNWKFVSAKSLNFDTNLLNDREVVAFMVNYMNHALYYKVIETIKRLKKNDKDIKIKYINNNNYDIVVKELG